MLPNSDVKVFSNLSELSAWREMHVLSQTLAEFLTELPLEKSAQVRNELAFTILTHQIGSNHLPLDTNGIEQVIQQSLVPRAQKSAQLAIIALQGQTSAAGSEAAVENDIEEYLQGTEFDSVAVRIGAANQILSFSQKEQYYGSGIFATICRQITPTLRQTVANPDSLFEVSTRAQELRDARASLKLGNTPSSSDEKFIAALSEQLGAAVLAGFLISDQYDLGEFLLRDVNYSELFRDHEGQFSELAALRTAKKALSEVTQLTTLPQEAQQLINSQQFENFYTTRLEAQGILLERRVTSSELDSILAPRWEYTNQTTLIERLALQNKAAAALLDRLFSHVENGTPDFELSTLSYKSLTQMVQKDVDRLILHSIEEMTAPLLNPMLEHWSKRVSEITRELPAETRTAIHYQVAVGLLQAEFDPSRFESFIEGTSPIGETWEERPNFDMPEYIHNCGGGGKMD